MGSAFKFNLASDTMLLTIMWEYLPFSKSLFCLFLLFLLISLDLFLPDFIFSVYCPLSFFSSLFPPFFPFSCLPLLIQLYLLLIHYLFIIIYYLLLIQLYFSVLVWKAYILLLFYWLHLYIFNMHTYLNHFNFFENKTRILEYFWITAIHAF